MLQIIFRVTTDIWATFMSRPRLPICIAIISAAITAVIITAFTRFKGSPQIKNVREEPSISFDEPQIKEVVIDINEKEIREPDQTPCVLQADNPAERLKQQEQDKLRSLEQASVELDNYVTERRKEIETWYTSELARLKLWAESRAKELDEDAKVAYARCLQKMQNTVSNSTAVLSENTYVYADTYYSPYGYATTNGYAYTDGVLQGVTRQRVVGDPVGDYKFELENIKESQRSVEDVFSELSQKRERYLWELEVYARSRRLGIEAQKRLVSKNTEVKLAGGPGVVDAISCSGGKPCIMFSGEILHEGDSANGFKIIKIHEDRVEFEKDGEVWIQDL